MASINEIYLSGVGYDLQDVKAPEAWVTTAATVGSGDYSGVRLYEKRRGSGSTLYNNFEMMFANINGTSVLGSNSFSLQPTLSAGTGIDITNNVISVTGGGGGGGSNVVELTQAQYDALVTGGTVDADTFYIITDATEIDASSFYTTAQTSSSTQISTALALKADAATTSSATEVSTALAAKADAATTSSATEVSTALAAKQNTLSAGTGIDITNDVISVTGGGGGGGTIDSSLDDTSPNAVANSAITNGINAVSGALTGYVTTNTAQDITGQKTFVGTKMVYFDQSATNDKLGFTLHDKDGGEFGAFELNPSGITIDSVKRPLMTLNHYRGNGAIRDVQTTIGIRQYDSVSKGAYNLVAPLPENAKTPFSLTTTIKNLWIPIGVKTDSSTILPAENSGVIDLSSAFAAKQNTLSAGTGIDITNDVISVTGGGGGGGGTIDASLDSSSPNAVANSAITNAVNSKVSDIAFDADSGVKRFIRFSTPNTFNKFILQNFKINGTPVLKDGYVATSDMDNYQLVETSAITTTLSSSSTDSQVPSAKAVYDIIGDIESLLSNI
jgi:hypothetical protein